MGTVPMFAPDGTTTGEIPAAQVAAAQQAGFKRAYDMTAPDGKTTGYIPEDRAAEAVKSGFKLTQPADAPSLGSSYWEALTNPVGSGGRDQGLVGGALQVGGQAIKAMAQPFEHPLDTVGNTAKLAGEALLYPQAAVNSVVAPLKQQYAQDKTQGGNALAAENLAGQGLGTIEGGRMLNAGAKAAAPVIGKGMQAVSDLTPKARMNAAGQLFNSVAQDANKMTVDINNASDGALKLMNWQKKTQLGPTINKFLNQITKGDLTYEDARDYYELFGKMSVDESLKMAAPVKRDFMNMVAGLKQDIGNAAEKVGRLADYNQAMGDYATAAKHQQWYETAKDLLQKGALGAAGLGGIYSAWQKFNQ